MGHLPPSHILWKDSFHIGMPNLFLILIVLGIVLAVLLVLLLKRKRKNLEPDTVCIECDPSGLSDPHYIAPEDDGVAFLSFIRQDGTVQYKVKPRKAITIPDAASNSWIRLFASPKGSDYCVELSDEGDELISTRVVAQHSNQFRDLRRDFQSEALGAHGKLALVLMAVLGFMVGIMIDAAWFRVGASRNPAPAPEAAQAAYVLFETIRMVW